MLQDTASFHPVYEVLMNGRMETIDEATFGDLPFVLDQTSAVSIKSDRGKVIGQLTHVVGDGTGMPHIEKQVTRP
jgi:hypothetical protein